MTFDLASAKPVESKSKGFDLASARPVGEALSLVEQIPDMPPDPKPAAEPSLLEQGMEQARLLGRAPLDVGEAVMSGGMKLISAPVGAAIGLVKGLFGGKLGTPEGVREASELAAKASAVTPPQTPGAREYSGAFGDFMDRLKVAGVLPETILAGMAVQPFAAPQAGAAVRSAAESGVDLAKLAGRKVASAVTPKPNLTGIPPEAVFSAIKNGFRVPPSMGGAGMVGKATEGLSGKQQTAQRLSLFNSENMNKLAREDLGIPAESRITEEGLNKIRAVEGKAFQAIKELDAPIVPNEEYLQKIRSLGGDYKAAMSEFPDVMKNEQIDTLIAAMSAPRAISGRAAVEVVKKLRHDATANLKAFDDPHKRALGLAQRQAAQAVDELVESRLAETPGKEGLAGQYKAAREKIAKTYDVEAALNDATGNVSLRVLGKLDDKGRPLSGGLKKGADFYNSFEKAGQDVEKIGSQPGLSPLDYAVGIIPAVASGHWPAAGLIASRPIGRAVLTSKPYQNMLGRRAAKAAGGRFGEMLESTADKPPPGPPAGTPPAGPASGPFGGGGLPPVVPPSPGAPGPLPPPDTGPFGGSGLPPAPSPTVAPPASLPSTFANLVASTQEKPWVGGLGVVPTEQRWNGIVLQPGALDVAAPKPAAVRQYTPEVQAKLDAARAKYEQTVAFYKRNNANDPQMLAKDLKGAGMRYAAEKREITGELTGKEAAEKALRESPDYMGSGKDVSVDGLPAKVVRNSFGRVQVAFEDGRKLTVDRERIRPPGAEADPALMLAGLKPPKATSLLPKIKEMGGIDPSYAQDLTGESKMGAKGVPLGLFAKGSWKGGKGTGLDDLATRLQSEGWPIDTSTADGGVAELTKLIQDELGGKKTYSFADQERVGAYELDVRRFQEAEDAKPIAAEFKAAGLEGADEVDATLVAKAAEIDEAAFERLTMQFADDDAGFMQGIKEIIDGANKGAKAGEGGKAGAGAQAFGLEGETEAQIRARENAQRLTAEKAAQQAKAPSPQDFVMTGSARAADEAAARGQTGFSDFLDSVR